MMDKTLFPFTITILLSWMAGTESLRQEAEILLTIKSNLIDSLGKLEDWRTSESPSAPCDWNGITCDNKSGKVIEVSLTGNSNTQVGLRGQLPSTICDLAALQRLDLKWNELTGTLPSEIYSCKNLRSLNLSYNYLSGPLPDFSKLTSLRELDLTHNSINGPFPVSVASLKNLTGLYLAHNPFNLGRIPSELGLMKKLRWLYLSNCSFVGEIPNSLFELQNLQVLELARNSLNGSIPKDVYKLENLVSLQLSANSLSGSLPKELGMVSKLEAFNASKNMISGSLPEEIGGLRNLIQFGLYMNNVSGVIPESFAELPRLMALSMYRNNLSGSIPPKLGLQSKLVLFDLSKNMLGGELPKDLCKMGVLLSLLVDDNLLTGKIPDVYGSCWSLRRLRVNNNLMSGWVSDGIWGLPNVNIIDLSSNGLEGRISSDIRFAKQLNELYIQKNKFSGSLVPQLGKVEGLTTLDASNNQFTGSIPIEIGQLKKLNNLYLENNALEGNITNELGSCIALMNLDLSQNRFGGSIPESLGNIQSLNMLNLSNNFLDGSIPDSLGALKLGSLDFSQNRLIGPVPDELLTFPASNSSFLGNPGLCKNHKVKDGIDLPVCGVPSSSKTGMSMTVVLSCAAASLMMLALIAAGITAWKRSKQKGILSFSNLDKWDTRSFHGITFSEKSITKSLVKRNMIGCGGWSTVYKVVHDNQIFAVKQIVKDHRRTSKHVSKEIEILGAIRHKNIVKLYGCMSNRSFDLLIFDYMYNGSLHDALHNSQKEGKKRSGLLLTWPIRQRIALGVAHGLSYLHHDCLPKIIHRDVKASNILLDIDNEAKISDFGISKTVEATDQASRTLTMAGTRGYMAPELAYGAKDSEKSDVYSFGVVLMELLTGKAPSDIQFQESSDLVGWVSENSNNQQSFINVLDPTISELFHESMIKMLQVALLCTFKTPSKRPTMQNVVRMLLTSDSSQDSMNSEKQFDYNPYK